MAESTATDEFADAVSGAGGVDLLRAAICTALIVYSELDVEATLAHVEELVKEVRGEVPDGPLPERTTALAQALFVKRGFNGNRDDYDDPRNCYLHEVLARRTGLPITLSILYIEIARRLSLPAFGIGFPSHFIVRTGEEAEATFIDPFNQGRVLSRDDLARMLHTLGGNPERQLDTFLAAVTPRQVLTRLLNNLKRMYIARANYRVVGAVIDLILVLTPWELDEIRDRGIISGHLRDTRRAIADLSTYLEHRPEAADGDRVRRRLDELRRGSG